MEDEHDSEMQSDHELEIETEMETEKKPVGPSMPDRATAVRNQHLRRKLAKAERTKKKKAKKAERRKREQEELPKQVPHTIESLRIPDETTVNITDEKKLEIEKDNELDELSSYFKREVEPKVLITYSDNPHKKTRIFGRELSRVIPNSINLFRKKSSVKKIIQRAIEEDFTDVIVVNEDFKEPNGLLLTHLPNGPTALFRLSNVKITTEMKRKNYKAITSHRPEVILNNFSTRLGWTVSRMLAALFHYDPEFKGRRAVTFHNQRDYIFFRHHKYDIKSEKRAALKELGPRFTMKLRSLQHGTFDSKTGDYEWTSDGRRHEIETSRRKFFL